MAPIILPAESNGDGDAVGLSAEIGQRLCRTAKDGYSLGRLQVTIAEGFARYRHRKVAIYPQTKKKSCLIMPAQAIPSVEKLLARTNMEAFDYVIIGAGSAGSVLANRLSQDANVTVCVLEAGPRDWHPFIHIPAGFIYTRVDPRLNWLYMSEPSEWTGGRAITAPRGKTLGGSSSINGHIYNRGQRLDFDGWAQCGNLGWGYADVLPYFRRTERRMGGEDLYRGREGNLPVTDFDWCDPLCEAFIEGAVQMGIPRNPDYNGAEQAGVSYVQRIIEHGRRKSAAHGYLHPAMKRKNLTVRTHAHASEIVLDGKRAVGVRYHKGGRNGAPTEVRARKEVILSGGAVNSPQLLQVSGIGPAPLLKSLGIEVKHALAGVGENLRDHYSPRFVARVKNAITINERSKGLRLVGEVLKYAVARKGILALNPTPIYVFWKSNERFKNYDLQFSFTPGSYKDGVQSNSRRLPRHDHRVVAAAARQRGLRARSLSGSVRASCHPTQLSCGRR